MIFYVFSDPLGWILVLFDVFTAFLVFCNRFVDLIFSRKMKLKPYPVDTPMSVIAPLVTRPPPPKVVYETVYLSQPTKIVEKIVEKVVQPEPQFQLPHVWIMQYVPILKGYFTDVSNEVLAIRIIALVSVIYLAVVMVARFRVLYSYLFSRITLYVGTFSMEKMMPGSALSYAATLPKFQGEIWIRRGGSFDRSGQCFFTQFGCFTAAHVLESAEEVAISTAKGRLVVSPDRFDILESDVALMRLTDSERSVLQVATGKLMAIGTPPRSAGLIVRVQAFKQTTMGILEPDEGFGLCVYRGSTTKGFSGAPYFVGNMIYGMHAGGSAFNIGYEAAYLYMLAANKQESTEDFIEKEIFELGKSYVWQRSPYNPDEARVNVDGKYFLVDLDKAKDWAAKKNSKRINYEKPSYEEERAYTSTETESQTDDEVPRVPAKILNYEDKEAVPRNEPKNEKGQELAPAMESGKVSRQTAHARDLKFIRSRCQSLEDKFSLILQQLSMHGQPLTPVPQNEALPSTSKSSSNSGKLQMNPRAKKAERPSQPR